MAKTNHPDHDLPGRGPAGPGRPDQGPARPERPERPGGGTHPDQELPEPDPPAEGETPTPKSARRARDVDPDAPATSVSQLLPASAAIGDPSFALQVIGSGFDETSVIVFAGEDEPTTFVADTALTTVVDMSVWQGPDPAIPVLVRTTTPDGPEESNALDFVFTEPRAVPLPPAYASQPIPAMDLI